MKNWYTTKHSGTVHHDPVWYILNKIQKNNVSAQCNSCAVYYLSKNIFVSAINIKPKIANVVFWKQVHWSIPLHSKGCSGICKTKRMSVRELLVFPSHKCAKVILEQKEIGYSNFITLFADQYKDCPRLLGYCYPATHSLPCMNISLGPASVRLATSP